MDVSTARATGLFAVDRTIDSAALLRKAVGDISELKMTGPLILVATYVRPEKLASGIILAQETLKEDEYQGKVGLVLVKGPNAFVDDDKTKFRGVTAEVGQWVVYSPMDGMPTKINGTLCRVLEDVQVKLIVPRPEMVL